MHQKSYFLSSSISEDSIDINLTELYSLFLQ